MGIGVLRNREFEWLFGDLFARRVEFERNHRDFLWSQLIRKFQTVPIMAQTWATFIDNYRSALVNPDDAPRKIADELKVDSRDFDAALLDSFAEISAIPQLRKLGFDSFEVLLRSVGKKGPKTPDLKALLNGEVAALEVKNLRAHECVETLLPKFCEDQILKGQNMSGLRLVVKHSFRDTLKPHEKEALAKIPERAKDFPRNEDIEEVLSERAVAKFQIVDGTGDVMCSDDITVSEVIGNVREFRGLFTKISADLDSAVRQLYSPVVSDARVRVAVMHWDIPWFRIIVPGELQRVADKIFRRELARLERPVELLVFSDYEFDLFSTLNKGREARQNEKRSGDIEKRILERAYEIYEKRINSSALSDWLQAESEILACQGRTAARERKPK